MEPTLHCWRREAKESEDFFGLSDLNSAIISSVKNKRDKQTTSAAQRITSVIQLYPHNVAEMDTHETERCIMYSFICKLRIPLAGAVAQRAKVLKH